MKRAKWLLAILMTVILCVMGGSVQAQEVDLVKLAELKVPQSYNPSETDDDFAFAILSWNDDAFDRDDDDIFDPDLQSVVTAWDLTVAYPDGGTAFSLSKDNGDDLQIWSQSADSGAEYAIPREVFTKEGLYAVTLNMTINGYEPFTDTETFTVTNPFVPDPMLWVSKDNDPQKVEVDAETGAVAVLMHQWIDFDVSAPGANGVTIFWMDEDPDADEENPHPATWSLDDKDNHRDYERYAECWPGEGTETIRWTPDDLPDGEEPFTGTSYVKYIIAEAHYYDESTQTGTHRRACVKVTVNVENTISAPTYSYNLEENNIPAEGEEAGIPQISRDGILQIDVNNVEGADFYGAYILKDETRPSQHYWDWIASSHWVASDTSGETDGKTRLTMGVPRCEPGDYKVHVYAIKYGAPQVDAEEPFTIHVTDDSADSSPVIVSMKDEYTTGEPLRVFAHYTNPQNIQGWMTIQIRNVDDDYDIIFDKTSEFYDFYEVDTFSWGAGTFAVDAIINWYGENGPEVFKEYRKIKTIQVNATGKTSLSYASNFEPVSSVMEGNGFSLSLQTVNNVENNQFAADIIEVGVFCIDNNGWEEVVRQKGTPKNGSLSFTINGMGDNNEPLFKAGSEYQVNIDALKPGTQGAHLDFYFFAVSSDTPQTPPATLTVNIPQDQYDEETEKYEIGVFRDARVEVQNIAGETRPIRWIRLMDGGGLLTPERTNPNGLYRHHITFDKPDEYTIYAFVAYDDDQNEEQLKWYKTNDVTIQAKTIELTFPNETEEGQIQVSEDGVTTVSGHYYYKAYISMPKGEEMIQTGFGDVDDDEPKVEVRTFPASKLRKDDGGYYMFTLPPEEPWEPGPYTSDAFFYRLSDEEDWQKVIFEYNANAITENPATITSLVVDDATDDQQPVTISGENALVPSYTVWSDLGLTWTAMDNVDGYFVVWSKRNEPKDNPWWRSRLAEKAGYDIQDDEEKVDLLNTSGTYDIYVLPMVGGTVKAIPDQPDGSYALQDFILSLEKEDEAEELNDPVPLYSTVNFRINAQIFHYADPDDDNDKYEWRPADHVELVFGTPSQTEGAEPSWADAWTENIDLDESGDGEYEWFLDDATLNAAVRAEIWSDDWGENDRAYSDVTTVTVAEAENWDATITAYVANDGFDPAGINPLQQDQWLYVTVENQGDLEARYYGVDFRVLDENSDGSDNRNSDRVFVENMEPDETGAITFQVPLSDLEIGKTYGIYVYAIKPGLNTIWTGDVNVEGSESRPELGSFRVVRPWTDSDLVISDMKDVYQVGEPLNISAVFSMNEALADDQGLSMEVRVWDDEYSEHWFEDKQNFGVDHENDPNHTFWSYWNDDVSLWTAGDYHLEISIYQRIEDEEDNRIIREFRDFSVEAKNGALEEHKDWKYNPKLPEYFPVQDKYVLNDGKNGFTLPGAPAEWYDVAIYDADNNRCYWNQEGIEVPDPEDENPSTPPEIKFNTWEGMRLTVEISAYAEGYSQYYFRAEGIPVLKIDSENHQVTIKAYKEDGAEATSSLAINERLRISVSAPDASWIDLYDSCSNGESFWHEDEKDFGVCLNHSVGEDDYYQVWARAGYEDENGEWEYVNSAPLTFTLSREEDDPQVEHEHFAISYPDGTDGVNVDADNNQHLTVNRGDIVTVELSPSANATDYWLNLERDEDDDQDYDWRSSWVRLPEAGAADQTCQAVVYTAALPEGTYWVSGVAAAPGYRQYDTEWDNQVVYLHVEDPDAADDEGNPVVRLEVPRTQEGEAGVLRVSAETGEMIHFSIYAKDANGLNLYMQWPDSHNDYWDGGYAVDSRSYDQAGTYWMVAEAWYPCYDEENKPIYEEDEEGNTRYDDEGYPVQKHYPVYSDMIQVTVTARENLSLAGKITENIRDRFLWDGEYLDDDEPFISLTANMPDHADYLEISVNVAEEDGNYWDEPIAFDSIDKYDEHGALSLSVTYNELMDWEVNPGQAIIVEVKASGAGYNRVNWVRSVPVVDRYQPIHIEPGYQLTIGLEDDNGDAVDPVNNVYAMAANEDKTVRIRLTGHEDDPDRKEIRTVRLFNGVSFESDECPDQEDGSYVKDISFTDPGTYTVYALVTYDEWDDDWAEGEDGRTWFITEPLGIEVAEPAKIAQSISIKEPNPKVVTRGETVQIEVVTGWPMVATDYWIEGCDFEPEYGELYYTADFRTMIDIGTWNLTPGTYWICGVAGGADILSCRTAYTSFTVKEREDIPENGVYLNIGNCALDGDSYTLPLNKPLDVFIYAPGADKVGFYLDNEPWHLDENGNYNWGDGEHSVDHWYSNKFTRGDGDIVWDRMRDTGEHTLKAVAYFPDDEEWTETEEIIVNVTGKGILGIDSRMVSTGGKTPIPDHLVVGQQYNDFAFTFVDPKTKTEVVSMVDIKVSEGWNSINGWNSIPLELKTSHWDQATETRVPINQAWLAAEHAEHYLELHIDASAVGYEGIHAYYKIPIIMQYGIGATISVREKIGEDQYQISDRTTALKDEFFEVCVVPSDGKTIEALRFFGGGDFWERGEAITPQNHDDWFEWNYDDGERTTPKEFVAGLEYNETGVYPIYARVKLSGEEEWITTNVLSMEITAAGQLGTIDMVGMSEDVDVYWDHQRGEYLEVTLTMPEGNKPAEGVTTIPTVDDYYFWVDVDTVDGETPDHLKNISIFGEVDKKDPNNITAKVKIPTSGMDTSEDHKYILRPHVSASGWADGDCSQDLYLRLNDPDEAILELADEEMLAGTMLQASFYAPGAMKVWVQIDDEKFSPWGGESDAWSPDENWILGEVGPHTIVGWAYYSAWRDEDGNWDEDRDRGWENENNWFCTEPQTFRVIAEKQWSDDWTYRGPLTVSPEPKAEDEGRVLGFTLFAPDPTELIDVEVLLTRGEGSDYKEYKIRSDNKSKQQRWGMAVSKTFKPEDARENDPMVTVQAGDFIVIRYSAYATGYEALRGETRIPVVEQAIGTTLSLSIAKWDGEKYKPIPNSNDLSVFKNEKFKVRVIYQDQNNPKTIEAVKFFGGKYFWEEGKEITPANHKDWFEDVRIDEQTTVRAFTVEQWYDDPGVYPLYALVKLSGENDWRITNVLPITVDILGQLGSIDLDWDAQYGGYVEMSCERGEYVTVPLTMPTGNNPLYDDATVTEEDYDFWVNVNTPSGDVPENLQDISVFEGIDTARQDGKHIAYVKVPTAGMDTNETFILTAQVGANGWETGDCVRKIILNVYDPEEALLILQASEMQACTPLRASFYAPGAKKIWIQLDDDEFDENDIWDGECDNWVSDENWTINETGRHSITGWAYYSDWTDEHGNWNDEGDDGWKYENNWHHTETQYFRVTADGQVEDFNTVGIPAFVVVGDGMGIHIQRPENAESMQIQVELHKAGTDDEPGETYLLTPPNPEPWTEEWFHWGYASNGETGDFISTFGPAGGNCVPEGVVPEVGDSFQVNYQAYAVNKNARMGGIEIPVIAAAKTDEDHEVMLTVSEKVEDVLTPLVNPRGTTGIEYTVTVTAPGASAIRFYNGWYPGFETDEDDNTEFEPDNSGVCTFSFFAPEIGNYLLYAEAIYKTGEGESATETCYTSDYYNLLIEAENFATVPQTAGADVPEYFLSGNTPTVTVPAPMDPNGWCNVFLSCKDRNEDVYNWFNLRRTGDQATTIKLQNVQEHKDGTYEYTTALKPGKYEIQFRYHGTGLKANAITKTFTVIDPENAMILRTSDGRTSYPVGQDITFLADAPGADHVYLYRDQWDDDHLIGEFEDGEITWKANARPQGGSILMIAMAYYTEQHVTCCSELTITITTKGNLGDFDLALEPGDVEWYHERGEYLTVPLTLPAGTESLYGTTLYEEDFNFWVNVSLAEGETPEHISGIPSIYDGIVEIGEGDKATRIAQILVPTAYLDTNETYVISSHVSVPGWGEKDCEREMTLRLYDPDEALLTLGRTEIRTGEVLEASFYAPGARKLWIQIDDQEFKAEEMWDDEFDSWISNEDWIMSDSGRHTIVGWAYYSESQGKWDENADNGWKNPDNWLKTEPQTFRVTADSEWQSEWEYEGPEWTTTDADEYNNLFGFRIYAPDETEAMYVDVLLCRGEEESRYTSSFITGSKGWGTCIPLTFRPVGSTEGDPDCVVQPGDVVVIRYSAYATGFDTLDGEKRIPVIGESNKDVVSLEVQGADVVYEGTEDEHWYYPSNSNYNAVVTITGTAQEVKLYYGQNGFEQLDYNSDEQKWTKDIFFGEAGSYTLYAMARFADQNEEPDYWVSSNLVIAEVESEGEPTTGTITLSVNGGAEISEGGLAFAGQTLKVNVTEYAPPENVNAWFDLSLRGPDGKTVWERPWEWEIENYDGPRFTEFTIETTDQGNPWDAGEYRFETSFRQEGTTTVDQVLTFELVNPSLTLTTANGRRWFNPDDEIEFVAEAPLADTIILYRDQMNSDHMLGSFDKNGRLVWTPDVAKTEVHLIANAIFGAQSKQYDLWINIRSLGAPDAPDWAYANDREDNVSEENPWTISISDVPENVTWTVELKNSEKSPCLNFESEGAGQSGSYDLDNLPADTYTLTITWKTSEPGYDVGEFTDTINVWHGYEPTFTWVAPDNLAEYRVDPDCNFQIVCRNCHEPENDPQECVINFVAEKPTTCTQPGIKTFRAWIDYDGEHYEEEHTFEVEAAYGHDMGDQYIDWDVDEEDPGKATATIRQDCKNCDYSEEQPVAKGHITHTSEPATCTEDGWYRLTVVDDGSVPIQIEGNGYQFRLDRLGHDWSEWEGSEATCEHTGLETATCGNDPTHVRSRNIPKKEHEYEITTELSANQMEVTAYRTCKYDNKTNPTHQESETVAITRTGILDAPMQDVVGRFSYRSDSFENPRMAWYSGEKDESGNEIWNNWYEGADGVIPALKNLNVLKLPNGLTEIEPEAFAGLTNIQAVIIPASCTKIWEDAFAGCESLLYVKFENENMEGFDKDSAFKDCPLVLLDPVEVEEWGNG